jgi:hypothetical protein
MKPQQSRMPWIGVGVLGCLTLCLFVALASASAFLLLRSVPATPVAGDRQMTSPQPPTTPGPPKHYDHAEFTFDYPAGFETFDDFWPTGFGFSYKPERNQEFDADELGGVLLPLGPTPYGDRYLTSVQIYRKALPPGSSLKDLYEQAYSDQTYSGRYAKSNLVSDRTINVDGVAALEKVYRKPYGAVFSQFREVWLQKNSWNYIIVCRTTPSRFDEYQPEFNLVVDSFRVK